MQWFQSADCSVFDFWGWLVRGTSWWRHHLVALSSPFQQQRRCCTERLLSSDCLRPIRLPTTSTSQPNKLSTEVKKWQGLVCGTWWPNFCTPPHSSVAWHIGLHVLSVRDYILLCRILSRLNELNNTHCLRQRFLGCWCQLGKRTIFLIRLCVKSHLPILLNNCLAARNV